jgi:hypothetical protein
LGDKPLDGDVGVHAAVAERGVDLGLRAVGEDPLEALHHLPGLLRDRRHIRPVPRRVGLPPAAASATAPHGAPAAATSAALLDPVARSCGGVAPASAVSAPPPAAAPCNALPHEEEKRREEKGEAPARHE